MTAPETLLCKRRGHSCRPARRPHSKPCPPPPPAYRAAPPPPRARLAPRAGAYAPRRALLHACCTFGRSARLFPQALPRAARRRDRARRPPRARSCVVPAPPLRADPFLPPLTPCAPPAPCTVVGGRCTAWGDACARTCARSAAAPRRAVARAAAGEPIKIGINGFGRIGRLVRAPRGEGEGHRTLGWKEHKKSSFLAANRRGGGSAHCGVTARPPPTRYRPSAHMRGWACPKAARGQICRAAGRQGARQVVARVRFLKSPSRNARRRALAASPILWDFYPYTRIYAWIARRDMDVVISIVRRRRNQLS